MKILKKLAILVMALTLCVGVGATVVACDKDGTKNEQSQKGYSFKVVNADGTPAVGYVIQLCYTSGTCLENQPVTDEEGKVFFELEDTAQAYSLHVWSADPKTSNDAKELEFTGLKTIPANYETEISITLR